MLSSAGSLHWFTPGCSFFCHHHYTASFLVNCCAVFILFRFTTKLHHSDFHTWNPVVFWQSCMIPSNTKLWPIPTSWSVFPCDLWIFLIFCIQYIAYSIIRKINSVTLFMFIRTNLIMEFVLFSSFYPFLIQNLQGFFLVNGNLKRLVLVVQSTTNFFSLLYRA